MQVAWVAAFQALSCPRATTENQSRIAPGKLGKGGALILGVTKVKP